MRLICSIVAIGFALATLSPAVAKSPIVVNVGGVPAISEAGTFIALEKGYFRDAGLEVHVEKVVSASTAMALVASNRLQVVEGGLAVSYFNALAQGLPVIIAMERGSSPLYHDLLVRADLKDKIKTVADLKGRAIGMVARGSLSVYEGGKVLESGGLSLKDVEVKYIPFPQVGTAFANKALDAAVMIEPFIDVVVSKGLAVHWLDPEKVIRPLPYSPLAYFLNTEWAAKNKEAARNFFVAMLRGGREYCQAYHHGPNRAEVEKLALKYGLVRDPELVKRMPWQSRNPDGRLNTKSILDFQNWFYKNGMITKKFSADRLVDTSYATYAAKKLGPFKLINERSELAGCR